MLSRTSITRVALLSYYHIITLSKVIIITAKCSVITSVTCTVLLYCLRASLLLACFSTACVLLYCLRALSSGLYLDYLSRTSVTQSLLSYYNFWKSYKNYAWLMFTTPLFELYLFLDARPSLDLYSLLPRNGYCLAYFCFLSRGH
jgi:hypothetical protein